MSNASSVFDLFDEHDEYTAFLPAATFGYLYYLSGESDFVVAAVLLTIVGSCLISVHDFTDHIDMKYHENWSVSLLGIISFLAVVAGHIAAIIAGWNNTVSGGLVITAPNLLSDGGFLSLLFSKSIDDTNLFLSILVFLILFVISKSVFRIIFSAEHGIRGT